MLRGAPGYDDVAQPAIESHGVPTGVRATPRVRDHDRQRRQRCRRHVAASSPQAGDRPRGRPRVAGPLVRPVLSGALRRMDGGRRCRRDRALGGEASLRPVRPRRRVVRVLPEPVRVVGLQPRRPLAALGQGGRPRLAQADRPTPASPRPERNHVPRLRLQFRWAAPPKTATQTGRWGVSADSAEEFEEGGVELGGTFLLGPVSGAVDEDRSRDSRRGRRVPSSIVSMRAAITPSRVPPMKAHGTDGAGRSLVIS